MVSKQHVKPNPGPHTCTTYRWSSESWLSSKPILRTREQAITPAQLADSRLPPRPSARAMPATRNARHGAWSLPSQWAAQAIAAVGHAAEVEISSHGLTCRPRAAGLEAGLTLFPVDGAHLTRPGMTPCPLTLAGNRTCGGNHWHWPCTGTVAAVADPTGELTSWQMVPLLSARGSAVKTFAIAQELPVIGHWHRMACIVLVRNYEGNDRLRCCTLGRAGSGDHTRTIKEAS